MIQLLQDKPESRKYKNLQSDLKKAGLRISPEAFLAITYIFPLVVVFLLIAIKYTNVINTLVNIEKVREVAENLNKPEIAQISLKITSTGWIFLLISALIANMLPKWVLKLIIEIKKGLGEKEILMLQTYTIIMLKVGKPVKQILISLYERASAYKEPLELAINTFSSDPNLALQTLKNSVASEGFGKICTALEQSLNYDRTISLAYLENHRILGKEINKQLRIRKNTRKKIIGVLLMIFPLVALLAIGSYPWLIFTLKQIDNVPM
ncbi:hypothetical protein [Thermotalea metallivorans]|uniref:Type II secretion system protein GspF domain-containing protein n=1 Tax=Thermotalea metallivorans TaxID=520762 RepID=A0A140KZK3_9FIRM|nr:hypothetical protein [Thermotalea metallivorans]KXG73728.1 hypothetical protein AN619_29460 [Thermotalea metallivorans]